MFACYIDVNTLFFSEEQVCSKSSLITSMKKPQYYTCADCFKPFLQKDDLMNLLDEHILPKKDSLAESLDKVEEVQRGRAGAGEKKVNPKEESGSESEDEEQSKISSGGGGAFGGKHVKINDKTRKCKQCNVLYMKDDFLEHIEEDHLNFEYVCKMRGCHNLFTTKQGYELHVLIHKDDDYVECDYCDEIFSTEDDKKVHKNVHDKSEYPFKCKYCTKWKKRKCEIKAHLKNSCKKIQNMRQLVRYVVR